MLLGSVIWCTLGFGGLAAVLGTRGNDRASGTAFMLGVGLFGVIALYRSRLSGHWEARKHASPPPDGTPYEPLWKVAVYALSASGAGMTAIVAVALPLDARVSALVAGFLAGGGLGGLLLAAENGLWELQNRVVIVADAVRRPLVPRLFAVPRGSRTVAA